MAELAKEKAQNPELKKMAEKMSEDQKQEIEKMSKWRERYFQNIQTEEEKPQMADLSALEEAKGQDFDKKFAQEMIRHHKDGIKMTNEMTPSLDNNEIKKFAEKSVSKQNEEIKKLNELARKLGES